MSAILSLISDKDTRNKQGDCHPCPTCQHRNLAVYNRDYFQSGVAEFMNNQSKEALYEQMTSILEG